MISTGSRYSLCDVIFSIFTGSIVVGRDIFYVVVLCLPTSITSEVVIRSSKTARYVSLETGACEFPIRVVCILVEDVKSETGWFIKKSRFV